MFLVVDSVTSSLCVFALMLLSTYHYAVSIFFFGRIYDQCMCLDTSTFLGIEQFPQFPQLQKWLGLEAVDAVEVGHIVDPPVIRTATSIVPLGWSGSPADKNSDRLKVDVVGHGLHLCTLVQAQVNGNWYLSSCL